MRVVRDHPKNFYRNNGHPVWPLFCDCYTLSLLENDCDVSALAEEDAYYRARNLRVFSHVQKKKPGINTLSMRLAAYILWHAQ